MKNNIKMDDLAVAEIIGALLLLAMAVATFSVIYITVLSDNGPGTETFVTIVGHIGNENGDDYPDIIFEHNRGELLGSDTEVFLDIGGGDKLYNVTIEDNPDMEQNDGNTIWNIGERFIYHPRYENGELVNLTNVSVYAKILDKKSNSLVFWGLLQGGWERGYAGKGGIWHFDESEWINKAGEVKDSSGNENHGTARNGAKILRDDTSIPNGIDTIRNNAGYFDDIDDFVEVPSSYSLTIEDEITVEAWMKPLTFEPKIESQRYDDLAHGFTPDYVQVNGDIYAIASRGPSPHPGMLTTLTILKNGSVADDPIETIQFAPFCYYPNIIYLSGNIYVIAYQDTDSNPHEGWIATVEIDSYGDITDDSPLDLEQFETSSVNNPVLIQISDNLIAIAYQGSSDDGILKTYYIDSLGMISNGEKDIENFDNNCEYPDLIKISDNLIAVSYHGSSGNKGILKTYYIDSLGMISDGEKDIENFDNNCEYPDLIKISDNLIAIAYQGSSDDGILKTYYIDSLGMISDGEIDDFTFENNYCTNPDVGHSTGNYYGIVYQDSSTGNPKGILKSIEILPDGTINESSLFKIYDEIGEDKCFSPKILVLSSRIYAVIYDSQSSHPLTITTLKTKDPTSPYERGVFKAGSITIYADENYSYAAVTTNGGKSYHMKLPVNPDNWYHIALTFDGFNISFYCNQYGKGFSLNEYNYELIKINTKQTIEISSTNLYFGRLFFGYIDEVAIIDRALPSTGPSSIESHYYDPGVFENEPFIPSKIYNIFSSDITDTSANISWYTNEPSNSILKYGITTPPTITKTKSNLVASHLITLNDLVPGTTYYYEVQSRDIDGNTAIDNNSGNYYTFTTKNIMYIQNIDMSKNINKIVTTVKILDIYGIPVNEVNVYINLTLPSMDVISFNKKTNDEGKAIFEYSPAKTGIYICTVTKVVKEWYIYDYDLSVTNMTLNVP